MPRKTNPVPSYRRLRRRNRSDLAFVEIRGKRCYLGAYGSEESQAEYARLIAELQAGGASPVAEPVGLSVNELCSEFWHYAAKHYKAPGGQTTSELECYRQALRPLIALYGDTEAASFGPRSLKAVRQAMIDGGWSRPYINAQAARIRRVFKWGVGEELIPSAVLFGLQAVGGLQRGRSDAPEPEPIKPVATAIVDATLPHLTPTVRAMVELQRRTGMRPGEVCAMRTCDIDTSGKTWVYTPCEHKLSWRGKSRKVFLGPKARAVLKPRLRGDLVAYLFSPVQSQSEWLERRRAERKTAMEQGNGPGTNRVANPKRKPGTRYNTQSYGHAIAYACRRAWPAPDGLDAEAVKAWHRAHRWSPNQLRHSFATHVRREHGLEAAQVLLGHSRADVTQVYAERDQKLAADVALRIG